MKRYILDTNAIGDLINHRNGVDGRAKAARAAGHRLGTCGPVLGEFYYGLELSASRDENFRRARPIIKALVKWPFGDEAGLEFGRLRALLRRAGRQMQIPDMQLAAVALTLGDCAVVTADSDLSAVPGLAVENWAA
jgi:tRNA(fMet)-specific endonuclease VapC